MKVALVRQWHPGQAGRVTERAFQTEKTDTAEEELDQRTGWRSNLGKMNLSQRDNSKKESSRKSGRCGVGPSELGMLRQHSHTPASGYITSHLGLN